MKILLFGVTEIGTSVLSFYLAQNTRFAGQDFIALEKIKLAERFG